MLHKVFFVFQKIGQESGLVLLPLFICMLRTYVKLQLHSGIYRLRFYSNSLIYILSLSNSHNNIASIQKNRGEKSHRVIVALADLGHSTLHNFLAIMPPEGSKEFTPPLCNFLATAMPPHSPFLPTALNN